MSESEIVEPLDRLAQALDPPQHIQLSVAHAITKSEVEAQLDAAHRYPRSITKFLQEATALATVSQEVAESCMYTLPRAGKNITGPSVRLAEIIASAYGNLHVGARIVDVEDSVIVAQGVAWDLQKNLRTTIEVRRKILDKNGRRFNEDMITVTGNAASSIGLRNAVFRVVPRAYVDGVYEAARKVAVGNAQTLVTRRANLLDRLQKIGVSKERVLARLELPGVEDIGISHIEVLIGLGTAIRDGSQNIDDAFPAPTSAPVGAEQDGKRISMKGGKGKTTEAQPEKVDETTGEVTTGRQPGDDQEEVRS